jgi:predicted nucleotidyltransferase component of viral defense system
LTIRLLNKQELQFLNKKNLKYDLAAAEKDYMLALTIDLISKSELKDRLVFKGGTAIHHCYLKQSRFSEDLDFTSVDGNLGMKEVAAVLERFDFYDIKAKQV